ncbi:hypothetical protein Fmac_008365 [Flemingia macrophylla]|uniref:Uncharacterized protein n=1 Tax=Flemingia macrophylla TaxID=520843 RepID=A0ABD1MX62_9FABA
MASNSQQFGARYDAIIIKGFHHVATDTFAEIRKLESKLHALVNLVNQLTVNQKSTSNAIVFGINFSHDHQTNITTAVEPRYLIKKTTSNSQQFSERNHAIVIRGVHDMATYKFVETRKVEGKLDALVNLVTQLAVSQKSASIQFSVRNDVIINSGLHDVGTDTSTEIRKLEGKLDALVNLVTKLAVNHNSTSAARVFGIRSSNDHRTNACPSLRYSGVIGLPKAYTTNIYNRPPHRHTPDT